MTAQTVRRFLSLIVALVPFAMSGQVRAEVDQQLDSVDAVASKLVLEMQLGNRGSCGEDPASPDQELDPESPDVDDAFSYECGGLPQFDYPTSFAACQRAADRTLYCLLNSFTVSGKIRQPVVRLSETGDIYELFDCADSKLLLDGRRSNPCTSLTADLSGNIWLGGRDGSSHSVIKVVSVKNTDSCPTGFSPTPLTSTDPNYNYCFRRYATGRPVLVDMNAIDGRFASYFAGPLSAKGKGVLLLEDRKTVVFVADGIDPLTGQPYRPVEIATGKSGWGLIGNESVQSATLLQLCPTDKNVSPQVRKCGATRENYVLVTTSTGRVIARKTNPGPNEVAQPFLVYPSPPPPSTSTVTPQYWVRVSQQTGSVYVSDRSWNKVRQLSVPVHFPESGSTSLTLADDTLWTSPGTQASGATPNTLNTISVSPGIGVDLSRCGPDDEPCMLYPDEDGNAVGAEISNVKLEDAAEGTPSGLAVFRITGIPDCRYPTEVTQAICNEANAVETIPDENNVPQHYLRVHKLLPPEVLQLFDETTSPKLSELELLIGPNYRAREDRGNTFDAFFGRTEEGVVFRSTFDLKFDIGDLVTPGEDRTPTLCGFDPGGSNQSSANDSERAADWDAVVTVSERYKTVGSAPTLRHADVLVNSDCINPTSGSGDRWSLYAYGLMPTACTVTSSYECRSWFATLLGDLFVELDLTLDQTACDLNGQPNTLDGNSVSPLSAPTCAALRSAWDGTKPKLDNCIQAALDRKQSAADENCQAFLTQFRQYEAVLDSATVNGGASGDKANRLGELKARRNVLLYIYRDQFLPSIPFLP